MNKIKAVIYDVDGTLIDSEPLHVAAWGGALKQYGHALSDLSDDFVRTMAGKKPIVIAKEMIQVLGIDIQPTDFLDTKTRLYLSLIENHLQAMDGATDSIKNLLNAGYRLAIGTSLDRELLNVIMERLNIVGNFEVIITGDQIKKGKPDPETYLKVTESLNLRPQECIVIEDAQTGVAAAKSAGIWCIAIKNQGAIPQNLTKADLIIDSLNMVTEQLIESVAQD